MRLKRLFILIASTSGLLTVAMLVALLIVFNSHYEAIQREAFAATVGESVFQLSSLTGEYLLHQGERPRQQWLHIHGKLGESLSAPRFRAANTNPVVLSLREDHQKIGNYFTRVLQIFRVNDATRSAHEKTLTEQLQTSVYEMASRASVFSAANRDSLKTAQNHLSWLIGALLVLLSGNLFVLWFVIARRIIMPLAKLHEGIQCFGAETLNQRIELNQRDEIGELASSFNSMASQLQNSLVSREVLTQTVTERTHELECSNVKLRELARLKDEFLAGMSHELRTPLNAVLATTEMLLEPEFHLHDAHTQRALITIQKSGQHLLDLINDVLDVAKISAGKLELELSNIAPELLCREVVMLLQPTAEAKHIDIETHYEIIDDIRLDKRRIKQVLVNLLANAIKFTPNGGKVGLRFSADFRSQQLFFEIWDTGIGIADNKLDKLFQPFVQLDSSLSRKYGGTGLGLALVKSLVDLHGGSVSVESTFNQGSRFCVSLPWRNTDNSLDKTPATSASAQSINTREAANQQHMILVVDDSVQNLEITEDYLKLKQFRTAIASSGAEAIHQAREVNPDVILMDIQMPEMDGLETIRRLRSEPQFSATPIIALTALAMPGDRDRCLAAGANDYISKPVSLHHLLEMLEQVLGYHQHDSQ